jgi:hypothetical protein
VGNQKMAAESTGTYLLLKPDDETMLHNRDYYSRQDGILPDDFQPKQVCICSQCMQLPGIFMFINEASICIADRKSQDCHLLAFTVMQ